MTVEEVLRQSGFNDEQIKALDQKAITAFSGVLSTAEKERVDAQQAREAAELAQRSNRDFYENQIAPSLNTWGEEKSRLDGELAFYRAQNESLRSAGILPADAPGFQSRSADGRYVAGGPNQTPGSPQFFDVNKVYDRAGQAVGILTDIQWEHQRLFGQPLPVSPTELIRQADAVKLDPKTYAARTFKWDERRAALDQQAKEAERNSIVKEVEARKDREWSERVGSNPDIRLPQQSRYADHLRATRADANIDPLNMNDQQRKALTSRMIRKDIADAA